MSTRRRVMAGSYNACVDEETGKLLVNEDLMNLGDARQQALNNLRDRGLL